MIPTLPVAGETTFRPARPCLRRANLAGEDPEGRERGLTSSRDFRSVPLRC
jgi:hypothetical protein